MHRRLHRCSMHRHRSALAINRFCRHLRVLLLSGGRARAWPCMGGAAPRAPWVRRGPPPSLGVKLPSLESVTSTELQPASAIAVCCPASAWAGPRRINQNVNIEVQNVDIRICFYTSISKKPSGSSNHLDISGYRWISLDIVGYRWIWKDISWISLRKIGYLSEISKKRYPLEISKRYPRDIQRYPSHISMRDILWYISKRYPKISMLIQMEYPLQISMTYPQKLSRIYPMTSKDIQMNIHADILQISYVISNSYPWMISMWYPYDILKYPFKISTQDILEISKE
jgi:hypothetical protein